MELALFKTISRYPFIYQDSFYDSIELQQNKTCKEKCKDLDCIKFFSNDPPENQFICSKGFDNFLLVVNKEKYILNGLIKNNNKIIPNGRREARIEWIVDEKVVLTFIYKILEISKYIILRENESIVKNFAMFHDFKTSMNIFFRCTHDIINNLPGTDFEDKLENCDKVYMDLFNSLQLITSQLGMIDVIINPRSISFGTMKDISIFKLFYKIKLLFDHLALKKRDVSIELINVDGAYIRNSYCYESIEFIPLILLDNALKYSSPGSIIRIEIAQLFNRAKVKVKSIGPQVSDENTEKIFEKYFRDDSAMEFSRDGIGMGLWIAQQIMTTHGTKLYYRKDRGASGKIGLNIFEFELQTN
jgi:Osmosensitive K+ channel histidine kinase